MGKARTNKKSKKIKGGSYASLEPEDNGEPQPPRRKSKRTPKKTNKNLPSHDADLKLRNAVEGGMCVCICACFHRWWMDSVFLVCVCVSRSMPCSFY